MTEIRWYEEGKPHMRIKENKGVTWLSYQAFEQFPDIVHAFSTRLGGVSQGIYSSMNLSFTRGDEDAAVCHFGFTPLWQFPQTHGHLRLGKPLGKDPSGLVQPGGRRGLGIDWRRHLLGHAAPGRPSRPGGDRPFAREKAAAARQSRLLVGVVG